MIERELLELFISLAKIEGLSAKEKPVAEFIYEYLQNLGLYPSYDNSQDKTKSNTANILCEINGGGEVLLLSHMDTARSTNKLNVVERDDRLTSDGKTVLGVDNRVGNAVLLYTAKKIVKEKLITNGFTLGFTTCEETSLAGSKSIEYKENIKRAFVFDSYLPPGNFICSSLGAISFRINIRGKASHAGIAPEKGINAITIASETLTKIEVGKLDNDTTLNFGKIIGGSAVNVVPEEVSIEGEIRSFSEKNITEVLNDIIDKFERVTLKYNGSFNIEYNWDFKPYLIGEDEDVYKEIVFAISQMGLNPEPVQSNGGSDANSLNERGVPSVNIGIGAKNPHSNDEYILYQDLQNSHNIALKLVESNGK